MGDWFIGEIRLFPMNWVPQGWHLCDGAVMQISANQALYSLLGNTYGGDLKTYFNLPDLRGRVPVDQVSSTSNPDYVRGKALGAETVTLTITQTPAHLHTLNVLNTAGNAAAPTANTISGSASNPLIPVAPDLFATPGTAPIPLNPGVLSVTGAAAGHNNMQPFLAMNFCIATSGTYPPRN
jgi:microcystin-dependent protein